MYFGLGFLGLGSAFIFIGIYLNKCRQDECKLLKDIDSAPRLPANTKAIRDYLRKQSEVINDEPLV